MEEKLSNFWADFVAYIIQSRDLHTASNDKKLKKKLTLPVNQLEHEDEMPSFSEPTVKKYSTNI